MLKRIILIANIICITVLLVLLGGIKMTGKNEEDVIAREYQEDTEYVVSNDFVKLASIDAPMFGDVIAVLWSNDLCVDVQWGIGDQYFMWYRSGYPGFGYSMIIQADVISAENKENDIILRTSYGRYKYRYCNTYQAYCDDNDELLNVFDGTKIVNFGTLDERLYVYNPETHLVYEYSLIEQTKIIL